MSHSLSKSPKKVIIIRDLEHCLPDGRVLFSKVNLTLGTERTGIVGRNGIGKTTLFRLISGEETPRQGTITVNGRLGFLRQNPVFSNDDTVASFLNVEDILAALNELDHGSQDPSTIERIGNSWNLREKMTLLLEKVGLSSQYLPRTLKTLSGGEKMRVLWLQVLLAKPDFLLLDEPTNNLDSTGREALFSAINKWTDEKNGLAVVIHDRMLLSQMDRIIEISELGFQTFGGNFDFYRKATLDEQVAVKSKVDELQKQLRKEKKLHQSVIERQQKRSIRGKKAAIDKGIPRIMINGLRCKAEETEANLKATHEAKESHIKAELLGAKAKIKPENTILIDLPETNLPTHKIIAQLKNICFSYEENSNPIIQNFSLIVSGPERLAIQGKSGSGKTTLARIMLGEITPTFGEATIGVKHHAYLDQNTELLDSSLTLFENIKLFSPSRTESDLRIILGRFLFSGESAFKKVENLSGGERIRAALACFLTSPQHAPHLLVLDEPTNNLDLDSIERLESALNIYKGALVLISHDETFLKQCRVQKYITL